MNTAFLLQSLSPTSEFSYLEPQWATASSFTEPLSPRARKVVDECQLTASFTSAQPQLLLVQK